MVGDFYDYVFLIIYLVGIRVIGAYQEFRVVFTQSLMCLLGIQLLLNIVCGCDAIFAILTHTFVNNHCLEVFPKELVVTRVVLELKYVNGFRVFLFLEDEISSVG